MTPRVSAGAPVDALLFEARLNFETVRRGIGETRNRMRMFATKKQLANIHRTLRPRSRKTEAKTGWGSAKNAGASSVFVAQNEIAPPTHFPWPFSLV
jgi:hypothetical protein